MANRIQFPKETIETARANSRFGKYRFPTDLGPNSMVIDFAEYSYKRSTGGVNPTSRTKTSIVLPLPQQIQDSYEVIVNNADLGVGGAFLVDQFSQNNVGQTQAQLTKFLNNVESAGGGMAESGLSNVFDAIGGAGRYAKFISRSMLDSLPVNGLSLSADVVTGSAVNPHTTLNFDGVNLKRFQFSWKFAPRSLKESEELKNILNEFKYNILPKYSTLPGLAETGSRPSDRALLKYPNLAMVRFNGLAKGHYFEFKPGMISNFSVDYTPDGNVILQGGKPGIVQMSFTLSEAQIHTAGRGRTTTNLTSDSSPYRGQQQ